MTGFTLDVDRRRNILTVTYVGPFTLPVAQRAIEAAFERPDVSPSTRVLLDVSHALVHEIDATWLRRYQAFKDSRGYPRQVTAVVVGRDEGHQLLAQLWAALRTAAEGETPGVFTNQADAVDWLMTRNSRPDADTMSA